MTELQRTSMADIKQAISKGWITNVREDEITQNPVLAALVRGVEVDQSPTTKSPHTQRKSAKDKQHVIDQFLRCPKCRHAQHEYTYSLADKPWVMCNACGQLSAHGAWTVIWINNRI